MKKVLKILTLIMLIFTIVKIGDTYSKYYSSAHTNSLSKDIGEWVIKLNDLDIYAENGAKVQFTLNKFNNFSNEYASPDKIAPSSKGYTDIAINPAGTDVAVRYDIQLDLSSITDKGINAEAWLEIQSPTANMQFKRTEENTYSGTISLADVQTNQIATIRCYVEWLNDETKNQQDTVIGSKTERETIDIPVTVTVTQYLGEELVEYVQP